jgi:hypothetical protein
MHYRSTGRWDDAIETFTRIRDMLDDSRLKMEVEIEMLNTMMSAGMYMQASDKVFGILEYSEDIKPAERQKIYEILERLQKL